MTTYEDYLEYEREDEHHRLEIAREQFHDFLARLTSEDLGILSRAVGSGIIYEPEFFGGA